MGWFWADTTSSSPPSVGTSAPHPLPNDSRAPPPGCPMHKPLAATPPPPPPSGQSACPYNPPSPNAPIQPTSTPSYVSKLNPLNYMPSNISNTRESLHQDVHLPLERECSTIPRGDGSGQRWEYPSPQQMYNAMLRKGYTDTPADAVESMVQVHNFLNEGAWEEIRDWEHRFAGGLARGWSFCKRGEANAQKEMILEELRNERKPEGEQTPEPHLIRFMGRPSDPTPKSRILSTLAYLVPSQFPDNPPFDRHDWYVQRHSPMGGKKEVRYVIDYYSGPPEANGEPVFYLDVRPAVDGPTAACERLMRWGGDVWWRASGGSVREEMEAQKRRQGR